MLQMRWDVFQNFPEPLQKALQAHSLEEVNKVLGAMHVAEAEEVVRLLDVAGILSFSAEGIRDETGRAEREADADADDEDDGGEDAD